LIASGSRLAWIDVQTGEIKAHFPAQTDSKLRGYGRGTLAGNQVYWPTRDQIYVFDQRGPQQTRQPIELAPLGLTGGNLVISRDVLLIAAADQMSAFDTFGPQVTPDILTHPLVPSVAARSRSPCHGEERERSSAQEEARKRAGRSDYGSEEDQESLESDRTAEDGTDQ
jgi:hypothetical protein